MEMSDILNDLFPQTLPQHSAAMCSSKRCPSTLKIKVNDAHKTVKGYMKTAKCLKVPMSSISNPIRKLISSALKSHKKLLEIQ